MTQHEFQKRYTYNPVTDKLGEGGYGTVFKAYDTYRSCWVALKISEVDPQYENFRLRKEVGMVSSLPVHPNIAYYEKECYTFLSSKGEEDFAILQYYEDGNLSQLLKNHSLTIEQKQSILTQILEGADFLHNNGIIHRDLKPQNILIAKWGDKYIPKITDFGISKQLDANKSSGTNTSQGAGTRSYASPEQLGEREIHKNTDLWSFGVIAFQVLAGQLPFTSGGHSLTSEEGRIELFRQISGGQLPDSISQIQEPWQTIIRRCLIADSAMRIKSTQDIMDLLGISAPQYPIVNRDEYEEERTEKDVFSEKIPPPPEGSSPPPDRDPARWIKRLPYIILAITVAVALFFGVRELVIRGQEGSTATETPIIEPLTHPIYTPDPLPAGRSRTVAPSETPSVPPADVPSTSRPAEHRPTDPVENQPFNLPNQEPPAPVFTEPVRREEPPTYIRSTW